MPTTTLVTTTGDRPATFALAERYIARQTVQPDLWLVIDDGAEPTPTSMGQTVLRRPRLSEEPEHTLPLQWLYALPHIPADSLVVPIEDDDWYAPTYLQTTVDRLAHHDLVGEGWAVYCHVPNQWVKTHTNSEHCSLAATAWRASAVNWLVERCCLESRGPCIDSDMWRLFQGRKRVYQPTDPRLVVQLKGAPGRKGTLPSHFDSRHYVQDTGDAVLRARLGSDVDEVIRVFRGTA
jgi:hypothetical protein